MLRQFARIIKPGMFSVPQAPSFASLISMSTKECCRNYKSLPYGCDLEVDICSRNSRVQEEHMSRVNGMVMVVGGIVIPSAVYAGAHLMWNRSIKKIPEEKSEATLSSRSPS